MPCKKLDEIHELIDWTRLEKLLSGVHAKWLSERGIENSNLKRAYRHRPLGKEDKQFNRLPSGARSPVERVFGVLKQH